MTEFRLSRHDDVDLVFEGKLLSEVSSHRDGMAHWSEIRVYRTDSGQWVTEVVGRTTKPGEVDRSTVVAHKQPEHVRTALMRNRDGARFLTNMGRKALFDAAQTDPALEPALTERI